MNLREERCHHGILWPQECKDCMNAPLVDEIKSLLSLPDMHPETRLLIEMAVKAQKGEPFELPPLKTSAEA